MKITDSVTVPRSRHDVWEAFLDAEVLVRSIPGCERLEVTGANAYVMTVTAGVASIKGTYDGRCSLSDLEEFESLVMTLSGSGAPGTVDATVRVRLSDDGDGTTVAYDADATVGGMVGGVGQRMLASVSKRMAREFFDNLARAMADLDAPDVRASVDSLPLIEEGPAPEGQVFAAPPKPPAAHSQDDFLRGIAVGAGLVLLGALAGAVFGRRR
ncbi:MAG: carbon monoxide dehydrogenase subunit G [Nocardioides sp.]